jgi:hypothetical protein
MKNVSDKECTDTFCVQEPFFDKFTNVEKRLLEPGRPQMTIWRLRIACRISKAKNTNSECVILVAFPQQQWLHQRALV